MVHVQPIRVFPITAICGASGWFHIDDPPGLWPQYSKESIGVHGTSAHLYVIRLG